MTSDKEICGIGDYVSLDYTVSPSSASKNIEFVFNFGEENAYTIGNKVYITKDGPVCVVGKIASHANGTENLYSFCVNCFGPLLI